MFSFIIRLSREKFAVFISTGVMRKKEEKVGKKICRNSNVGEGLICFAYNGGSG